MLSIIESREVLGVAGSAERGVFTGSAALKPWSAGLDLFVLASDIDLPDCPLADVHCALLVVACVVNADRTVYFPQVLLDRAVLLRPDSNVGSTHLLFFELSVTLAMSDDASGSAARGAVYLD
jgi:hypothetical protein